MTQRLIVFLGSKLYDLNEKKELEEKALEEIKQLKEIIKVIESNPFDLCDLEEKHANYIVETLDLDDSYFDKVKKYKVIYDGYIKFGREAIPQIELVEEFIKETKKALNDRKFELDDEVANHQHTIVEFEELTGLYEELTSEDKAVTNFNLLFKLLESNSFDVNERNEILLEINESNNTLFEKENVSEDEFVKEEEDKNEYELEINSIQEKLTNDFQPATLNNLKSISDLLSSCLTKDDFDVIIDDWKFSFGDESVVKIIDGLTALKNIELLTIKELSMDSLDDLNEDIELVNLQIKFLEEYKKEITTVNKIEQDTLVVDTTLSKVEQALDSYVENPLETPTCLLFVNSAVEKDIKSITDTKTLEDVFLALQQFRNGEVGKDKMIGSKEIDIIKTKSKGNEARVACVKLNDNIYGVINITDRKDESPRNWLKTLEARRKSSDIDDLRKTINNPEVLEYHVTRTKTISNKLRDKVASLYGEKETVVSGGTK